MIVITNEARKIDIEAKAVNAVFVITAEVDGITKFNSFSNTWWAHF